MPFKQIDVEADFPTHTAADTAATTPKLVGADTGGNIRMLPTEIVKHGANGAASNIKTAYESNADTNAFTDADETKLDGIEAGATADQTGAEIKAAYEAELDTNAFDDAAVAKLAGIEAGATADQTGAEIKTAYEAELDTNAFTDAEKTKLAGVETGATADQSDAEIRAAVEAATDSNVFTDADHSKLDGIEASATADQTGAEIKALYEAELKAFTDAQFDKLAAIEAGATGDQTGAEIKALYEAELKAFTDAQFDKLAAIEANATADQTDAEIRAAVEAATDSNVFTDADHSKLDGIEAGADVTDTANVTAAGALMDSEVDADLKTLVLPANTTISAFGASLVDDASAAAARTTLGVDAAGTDNSTANSKIRAISATFDGGGSALTTGANIVYVYVPYACTINEVTTLLDQSGSIVIDIWVDSYANYPPTVADTITAAAKPTISTALKDQDSTLTGWSTSIAAGSIVAFKIDSVSTAKWAHISLEVTAS